MDTDRRRSRTWRQTLVDFFGLRKNIVVLLTMVILVGLGEKMAERFLPIYLLALGGSTLSVGLLNGMDNLLSALYSFPGGYLSDRLGYKRALILFNLIAMFGYLIVILVPTWPAVIVGSIFFLSWTAISLPATMDMVSGVLPKNKRTMGVSMHSLVRRIPMALGPVLGGIDDQPVRREGWRAPGLRRGAGPGRRVAGAAADSSSKTTASRSGRPRPAPAACWR